MRSIKIILLLLLLNCRTLPVEEPIYSPSNTIGCSKESGRERINCINSLLQELENIKNSQPQITIISKERLNDSTVRIKKQICHSPSLCFNTTQDLYSPTLWSEIKYALLISLPSVALGIIITTL